MSNKILIIGVLLSLGFNQFEAKSFDQGEDDSYLSDESELSTIDDGMPYRNRSFSYSDDQDCGLSQFDFSGFRAFDCRRTNDNDKICENDDDGGDERGHMNATNRFIRGGYLIRPGEYPSFVRMFAKYSNGNTYFCSGTLISKNMVITAAHCVQNKDAITEMTIKLGATNDGNALFSTGASKICSPKMYERFSSGLRPNDIAVIKLKHVVPKSNRIRPACLGIGRARLRRDALCHTVGSGKSSDWSGNNIVRALPVRRCGYPLIRGVTCYQATQSLPGSTCVGDSGGPTYCIGNCDGTVRQYVMGATSYGPIDSCRRDGAYMGASDFSQLNELVQNLINECSY